MYECYEPVEATVARNMGDEDWEELLNDTSVLAEGCSRRLPYEKERSTPEREPTGHHYRNENGYTNHYRN